MLITSIDILFHVKKEAYKRHARPPVHGSWSGLWLPLPAGNSGSPDYHGAQSPIKRGRVSLGKAISSYL